MARDTGGAIQGDRIDIFVRGNSGEVSSFGIQRVQVTVLAKGQSVSALSSSDPSTGQQRFVSADRTLQSRATVRLTSGSRAPAMTKTGSLSGWTIVVDPGHGRDPRTGRYTGAVGVNGVTEDQNVLDIGQRLVALLRAQGATVYITRGAYDPGPPPLQGLMKRVALAEKVHANLFISIHQNDGSAASHGVQTWYFTSRSQTLAQDVETAMTVHTGLTNLGVHRAGFYVVRKTTMPSVLVEGGFLSNRSEANLISTPAFHAEEAHALDAAIVHYVTSGVPKS